MKCAVGSNCVAAILIRFRLYGRNAFHHLKGVDEVAMRWRTARSWHFSCLSLGHSTPHLRDEEFYDLADRHPLGKMTGSLNVVRLRHAFLISFCTFPPFLSVILHVALSSVRHAAASPLAPSHTSRSQRFPLLTNGRCRLRHNGDEAGRPRPNSTSRKSLECGEAEICPGDTGGGRQAAVTCN